MLPRITEFVHNSFPIIADPAQTTRSPFEIFGVYLIDKEGTIRTFLRGTKEARPRLDLILEELAKIEGVEPPRIVNAGGKFVVPARREVQPGSDGASAGGDAEPLRVRWMWSHNQVRPGDTFKLAFMPKIARGFHVYAHNEERMSPFKVEFDWPEGIEIVRDVRYPGAEPRADPILKTHLAYHENDIALSALTLKASAELSAGDLTVTARIYYQACDESVCFPPAIQEITLPLKVVPQGKGRQQVFGWQTW